MSSIAVKNKKRVFVGLSGGVDSSVAAALLKKEGYDVTGVFIKTWHPDFLPSASSPSRDGCTWREERLDAMRAAAHLDIPFLTFDFENEYKKNVADYFISEYKMGRTPNPDVMCNKEIKFGAFLKKARAMGADFVATGHYARKDGAELLTGVDTGKDQAYFLWTLSQEQLSRCLFPIGKYKKNDVRKLAKKFGLPTAEKKDSQGICFLGKTDMKEFLAHYMTPRVGSVVSEQGKTIGTHQGAFFYTLGERHGFTITAHNDRAKPYYIVKKDLENNTIMVSHVIHSGDKHFSHKEINLENVNWISGIAPDESKQYTAHIRYHGEFLPCQIKESGKKVIFKKPCLAASGQSVVVYDGDVCLGGGIVA
ncbi:MAG: tRNA 2-thiouridine(34) synthase MnmA [Candidatus Lloydbacteria bacterium]|nr:tRNA 2-thiouridine(34) synthase MnmA [Candidatus Lloydbacteria bacterium]